MTAVFPLVIGVFVGFFLDIDITPYVLGIDGKRAIKIEWGKRDQAGEVSPIKVSFQLKDIGVIGGRFNGDNLNSPYFGIFKVGLSIGIFADTQSRFIGTIEKITPNIAAPGLVIVDIEAGDVTRIEASTGTAGAPAVISAAKGALTTADSLSNMLLYYPLEEDAAATRFDSPLSAAGTVAVTGIVNKGAYTAHPATPRMLEFGTVGRLYITVPNYTVTGETKLVHLGQLPDAGLAGTPEIIRMYCTGGNVGQIRIINNLTVLGTILIQAYSTTGVFIAQTFAVTFGNLMLGHNYSVAFHFTQSGANLDINTTVGGADTRDDLGNIPTGTESETFASATLGRVHTIVIGQDDIAGYKMGHLVLGNAVGAFSDLLSLGPSGAFAFQGYLQENTVSRLQRLEPVNLEIDDFQALVATSQTMGPQGSKSIGALRTEISQTDGGFVISNRGSEGRKIRHRYGLYNQPPALTVTLPAPNWHIAGELVPTDEGTGLANTVTVARTNDQIKGGSATASYDIIDDNHYNTRADGSPLGVGIRPIQVSRNVDIDAWCLATADWLSHLNSWKSPRWRQVQISLARAGISNAIKDITPTLYIGNVLRVLTAGANGWLPSDYIDLFILGGVEYLAQFAWDFVFNGMDAAAWETEVVETSGSVILAGGASAATDWTVATTLGPKWTTAFTPYYWQASGEIVKVTALSDNTITAIAAGAVSSNNNGGSCTPGLPAGMTVDTGQLMLCFAAIRNSGTGVVGTNPTGWATLVDFGNTRVMYRYYKTGDAAPTVTFTGGAAGDDTQARIFGFDGLSHYLASGASTGDYSALKSTPAAVTQLNGSVQDIAIPAIKLTRSGLLLYFVWKQDDWTSVAPPAGFTEIADNPTTTGNDQGISAGYLSVTVTDGPPGSLRAATSVVATGGAAAISRAILVHLRPTQHAIVERGKNNAGVGVNIAELTAIRTWRPGVQGL